MAAKTRRPGQTGTSDDWRDPGADSPDGGIPVIPLLIGFVLIAALVAVLVFNVFNIRDGILLPPFQGVPLIGDMVIGGDAYITVDGDAVIAADATVAELMAEVERLRAQLNTATALNTSYEETIARLSVFENFIYTYRADRFRFDQTIAAGDPLEFSTWFETMEPENAAYLYQQIQVTRRVDNEFRRFASTYARMDTEELADVFGIMLNTDSSLLIRILETFNNDRRAEVFNEMESVDVVRVTRLMEPDTDASGVLPTPVRVDNANAPTAQEITAEQAAEEVQAEGS